MFVLDLTIGCESNHITFFELNWLLFVDQNRISFSIYELIKFVMMIALSKKAKQFFALSIIRYKSNCFIELNSQQTQTMFCFQYES